MKIFTKSSDYKMILSDLCGEKYFPDLSDDFFLKMDGKTIKSFIDESGNIWTRSKKLGEGTMGKVMLFKSHNKKYVDLALKFFKEDEEIDIEEEMINKVNSFGCRNFINIGMKELFDGCKLVIMEKIDGDLSNLIFTDYENPEKMYQDVVKFIIEGLKCLLRGCLYFIDFKEENIGYKICENGLKFSFLDFGSFVYHDEKSITVSYLINTNGYDKGLFSNEVLYVYSLIITLLSLKLKSISDKKWKKFSDFVQDLEEEKRYKINLLKVKNYEKLKEKFYYLLGDNEDEFIKRLFEVLNSLTKTEPSIGSVLQKLDYYY